MDQAARILDYAAETRPEELPGLKILHVVPSFHPAQVYGGPIVSVYELCRALASSGCQVRVLTTDADGRNRVLEVEKGRPVILAENFSVRYCRRMGPNFASAELLRLLPGHVGWADVVHLTAVYNFPTVPTLSACRLADKPMVWSPRGTLQRWSGSRRVGLKAAWELLCRIMLPERVALHVTSPQEAQESGARFSGIPLALVANGVSTAEVEHVQGNGALRMVFLGRIDPKKGIENLLAACQLLNGTGARSWTLSIAGGGDAGYTAGLQRLARQLEVSARVTFVGEVRGEERAQLFAAADLAVFPSHTENFGMVVAEALAHGVPVIASQGMPWSEVEGRRCGLWVSNEPKSLAHAIRRAGTMPLREMGERGREWMRREFSWSSIAQQMAEIYRGLCQQRV